MSHTAITLLSGGLDSILTVRAVQKMGVTPIAVHFYMPFEHKPKDAFFESDAARYCARWGVELKVIDVSEPFLAMFKNPEFGYGSNMNPCVDCKILMISTAGRLMKEWGASFVATGEVAGQRPMSQTKDTMRSIEKRCGIEGYLVRPLCGKHLPETEPEKRGIFSRETLHALHGRGRLPQMALAKEWGIEKYPTPAGGCLLTDPQYALRLSRLAAAGMIDRRSIDRIRISRFFQLSPAAFLSVGKDEATNDRLEALADTETTLLKPAIGMGPSAVSLGFLSDDDIRNAAGIVVRYTRRDESGAVKVTRGGVTTTVCVSPIADDDFTRMMVV